MFLFAKTHVSRDTPLDNARTIAHGRKQAQEGRCQHEVLFAPVPYSGDAHATDTCLKKNYLKVIGLYHMTTKINKYLLIS